MFQNIQTHHRVETHGRRLGKVAMGGEFVADPQGIRPLLHEGPVMGIEIHKPDMVHLRQQRS